MVKIIKNFNIHSVEWLKTEEEKVYDRVEQNCDLYSLNKEIKQMFFDLSIQKDEIYFWKNVCIRCNLIEEPIENRWQKISNIFYQYQDYLIDWYYFNCNIMRKNTEFLDIKLKLLKPMTEREFENYVIYACNTRINEKQKILNFWFEEKQQLNFDYRRFNVDYNALYEVAFKKRWYYSFDSYTIINNPFKECYITALKNFSLARHQELFLIDSLFYQITSIWPLY